MNLNPQLAAGETGGGARQTQASTKWPALLPRGLQRSLAAGYIGVSATKFDELVADGRMPKPRCIDRRKVWDRFELDAAFAELPTSEDVNPWDALVR